MIDHLDDIALDIASEFLSTEEIQKKYKITKQDLNKLMKKKVFKESIGNYRELIDEVGRGVAIKAKAACNVLLLELIKISTDPDMRGDVRLRAIEMVKSWADPAGNETEEETKTWSLTVK